MPRMRVYFCGVMMEIFLAGTQGRRYLVDGCLYGRRLTQAEARHYSLSRSVNDMEIYLAGGIQANVKRHWQTTIRRATHRTLLGGSAALEEQGTIYANMQGGGVSVLESFYYVDEWTERTIPLLHNFMLDSGAFTFFTNNMQLAWEEIIDQYAEFINKNGVKLFFELDIDKLIGYERVKKLRKRLQDRTNKQPIPVWHKSRGREEFLRMADEFPYVSIGGIVSREIKAAEYRFFPWFIQQAHKRGTKIHGLGFTNLEGLGKYHFDSVDSTAWVSGNRFGAAYYFDGKTMRKRSKKQGERMINPQELAVNNFNEWVKFQDYARRFL